MRRYFAAAAAVLLTLSSQALAEHTVFFAIDSARIDSDGMNAISAAAEEYRTEGSTAVSVIGHTDTTASPEYNMALSRRRAEAVSAELVSRGVPGDQIATAGRGESDLALPTGDNVSESRNRRAVITVDAGVPVVEGPAEILSFSSWSIGIGPYIGFNNEGFDESIYLGANLMASYFATPNVQLEIEQAVFYSLGSTDEGVGSRTAVGANYLFADYGMGDGVLPYVGVNAGYLTVDGSSTGGWFAGPEIGLDVLGFSVKVAYDMVEDRDLDDGVVSVTVGYLFRF